MLRLIDDQVQRLVQFCDQRGLLENTLLVFLSDHGDFVGEYGFKRAKAPSSPSRWKVHPAAVQRPGIVPLAGPRVACFDHRSFSHPLPGRRQPHPRRGSGAQSVAVTHRSTLSASQEFSSIYAEHGFGGLPYDGTESLDPAKDGLTVSPGEGKWGRYDCLNSWTQSGTLRMVRKGDWKLLLDNLNRGQLYNLASDPAELVNLYNHPTAQEAQHALTAELALWMLRTQDPLPLPRANESGRRYIPSRG